MSEVHKYLMNRGKRTPLWFWQTAQGTEIDLLIETGPERFLAIECKAAAEVETKVTARFEALRRAYGADTVAAAAIVCRTEKAYPLSGQRDVAAIPCTGRGGLTPWLDRHLSQGA